MKKFLTLITFLTNFNATILHSMQKRIEIPNPLKQAIADHNRRVVSVLLTHGPARDDTTIIHKAVLFGGPTLLKLVLSHTTENINFLIPSSIGNLSPLALSIIKNNDCAEILLQYGADLNSLLNGATVMHIAAEKGYANLIELFLRYKMTVNCTANNDVTPLHLAAQNNHDKVVNFLVENGAIIDSKLDDGRTPLFMAAIRGNTDIIKTLLRHGAKIDARTDINTTPLLLAAQNGHKNTVAFLLENGADVNAIEDHNGLTPLYVAAYKGYKKIVRLLLDYKANINAQKSDGATPLFIASQEGHYKIVQLLLKNGADTVISLCAGPNLNKASALYVACQNGHFLVVRELVHHGANIFYQVSDCFNPLNWAYKNNHMHIVNYLEKVIQRKKQQSIALQNCIVCLEELFNVDSVALPCCKPSNPAHILHRDCYALIQATTGKCPLCRNPLPALE